MQFLIIFFVVLISSCVTTSNPPENWPEDLPPKSYFMAYYDRDEAHQSATSLPEYLTWVRRFYEGWALYPNGWLKTTTTLIESIETPDQKLAAKSKLATIGRLVSAEWAKDQSFRVINTRHLSIWGNALLESINKREQLKLMDQMLNDINGLLDKEIIPKAIVADRYYPQEKDVFF